MISIQSLLSKSIINLENGKHIGYAKNIIINKGKITHLVGFSETEKDFDTEFTLPTKTILSCQNDAIMLKTDFGLSRPARRRAECPKMPPEIPVPQN